MISSTEGVHIFEDGVQRSSQVKNLGISPDKKSLQVHETVLELLWALQAAGTNAHFGHRKFSQIS